MFSAVFSFGETEPCAQSLSPYSSFVIARKRAVFALRAEFLFLSFPKEKGTKKKGNLRACACGGAFAVKLNSDGQNSISHYLCYVNIKF